MTNKFVANGMIVTLVAAVLLGILESSFSAETNDSLTTLLGIAMFVFGIWSAVRLHKS